MFGFLKKLFGGDAETNKAAGVQVEQLPVVDTKVEAANQAPYKVEALVPEAVPAPVAKAPAKKKPQAAKPKAQKPAQKPAAITAPKKSGRKPKSKA
jgi:hypothetical protein